MLKGRCCVLFSDLKLLLLRPQASQVPQAQQTPPVLSPMSGPPDTRRESEGNQCSCAANNNNTSFRLQHWSVPSTECPVGPETQKPTAAEDFSKRDKHDERFSFISYAEGVPVCRICFQGPEQGELLSPCRCSGSVRSTHQPCLIKWISERGSWTCELCYYKYQVIAISTKNPLQWQAISLTVIEKVQIAAAILGSLFLIASISWLVWSSLSPSAKWQRQDLLFQICYGMYGFMDVVCIALIVHEGPSVFRIFHRWQAVNQKWKVLNYDKKRDSEELKASESEWTLSLMQEQPGAAVSPATSSLLAAAAAVSPDTPNAAAASAAAQDSAHSHGNGAVVSDHHCPYNFLYLLSHLRPHELRSQPSNTSSSSHQPRELVMRVTTV
ncbi:E3 ubiquitin-protein ligase MARCH4 [Astyanax mexicanus]|uniref:RING-type E3 ubiquitin transferase n=1 Tax=Astyanax mexicanus TaxID=7994 RepID=A0A8B9KXF0_ASTMX|nr:E3 ubiquitin-protein ligase MARCH4 [Astyanax mexicanus]